MSILDEPTELSGDRLELFLRMLEEEGLDDAPAAVSIARREGDGPAPASFAQRRLWFVDRLEPGSPAYNVPVAWRLSGALRVDALEAALTALVERHEPLRTTFREMNGEPVQRVLPTAPVELALHDLSALPAGAREAEARRLASAEARRPFDLAAGPLFRAGLLRLAATEHVLLLTQHHVVSDAWSLGVLFRELAALYEAALDGRPSPLAPLAITYGDYAAWQRTEAASDAAREQLAWWKEALAGAPALELPADRPRSAAFSGRGAQAVRPLGAELSAAVKSLARREGVTPFVVLLAAFQVLAQRYARQDDVVVGMAVAGRTRRELEELAGYFVNLLALRTDLSGDPSVRELLRRASAVSAEAQARQDVPFERLVEVVQPDRALGRTPLAQVVFGYQDASERALRLAGVHAEPFRVDTGTTHFDLTLNLVDDADGLRAECLYGTELFDAPTVDRLLGHYATLLAALVADPSRRISALPLLTPAGRAEAVAAGAARPGDAPAPVCLHAWFEAQAARTPHAVALTFEEQRLTYAELDGHAGRLARHLRGLGVGPESRVGLCVERSPELVVAILGVLKAGGAYVPLDPGYPADRLAYVLDDAGIGVLVTQRRLIDSLPEHRARVVCVDAAETWTDPGDGFAGESASPGNTAYVIYTSGSTGRPKGCAVTHANVARLFTSTQAWFGFGADEVWTLFHSCAFDFSVWELWGALLYGGRLVVVPFLVSREPAEFLALLERERVTVLSQTPSAFRQLARVDEEEGAARALALRWVVFGGEALEPASLRGWVARRGDASPRLVNMYGITETTVHVTFRPIGRAEVEGGAASVIGIPLPDLSLHLLDGHGEPQPAGVPGELYVGGAGVSNGYPGRPALAAQRFVPDPFSGTPGARLYRTGDLARRRADGDLEYLGRIDQQVKVRGFRIELGEVEAALAEHPALREAVVLVAEEDGDRRLVACVAAAQPAPTVEALRGFLRERLPEHMVPAAFVVLDALPLTPNGKADRKALLAMGAGTAALGSAYVAPRTPTEATLAAVWREVLGVERVGVHDNFFALGGDSIRSIRVLSLARERGVSCSLQQLYVHQTVAELAAEVGAAADPVPYLPTAPFSLVSPADRARLPDEAEDAYPLARLQAGMIYHMALAPDEPVYHNVDSFALETAWDADLFAEAVRRAVARHPILRTGFRMEGFSEPLQLVHREARLPVGVTDLRGLAADEQERAIAAYREAEARRPFDLARPPLLRFHVHRLRDDAFRFTLTECHPILDGWSLTSTLAEIFAAYAALLRGEGPAGAAPLQVTYRDFVGMERRALASEECRRFWEERVRGFSLRRLPRLPRDAGAPGERKVVWKTIHFSEEVHRALKSLEQSSALPLKTLALTAHLKVLSLLHGAREVATGFPCNGRPEVAGGEQVRGLFLNTVPFRASVEGGSWLELARGVLRAEREMLPFRHYPMSALQDGRGAQPLFETAFNFVHFHALGDFLKGGAIGTGGDVSERADTSFTLVAAFGIGMVYGGLRLMLCCDARELSPAQIDEAAALYEAAVTALAADPHARHDARPLAGDDGVRRALLAGTGPSAEVHPLGLHRIVESRAAAEPPETVAVQQGGDGVAYGTLNRRANRLARVLVSRGVGAEARVGVCVERSAERVAAMLAVLKAGGAVVPLDPAAAPERLAAAAREAGVRLVVAVDALHAAFGSAGVVRIDADAAEIAAESGDDLNAYVPPGALAFVVPTAASGGRPRGVLLTHRAVANAAAALAPALGAGTATRFASAAAAGTPAEVLESVAALAAGAVLCLPAAADPSPEALAAFLRDCRADAAVLAPEALAAIRPDEVPSLAAVATEAGRCTAAAAAAWAGARRFVPFHGLAEAGLVVSADGDAKPSHLRRPAAGRAVANARVHVLDAGLHPAPVGTPGELWAGGAGLARGYAGRPGLTADRFRPDPFSATPGERLFRTGRTARRLADGGIELVGGGGRGVVVLGHPVELDEIEAALARHPAVREAVVTVRDRGPGRSELAAHVSARFNPPSPEALRTHLEAALPAFMVPPEIHVHAALPRTVTGEVDVAALTARAGGPALPRILPESELERAIAEVWCEVLGAERVGADENFFDVGGNSLLVARVRTRLQERFGRELSLVALLRHTTIRALAAHLARDDAPAAAEEPEADRGEQRRAGGRRRGQGRGMAMDTVSNDDDGDD
jgi:amino acid adenylation domain-containing protein